MIQNCSNIASEEGEQWITNEAVRQLLDFEVLEVACDASCTCTRVLSQEGHSISHSSEKSIVNY